jgi:hypothetical protein
MSLFETKSVPCPACGADVKYSLVYSVNADRRPDLRDAIVNGTFQAATCGACGAKFRVQPEFNFFDSGRGLWLAAFPLKAVGEWRVYEENARRLFDTAYGPRAPAAAREIGKDLVPRVTFGWAAVREKIVAFEGGLDDVTLELCKLAMMRGWEPQPLATETELRLYGFEGDDFVMAWIISASERVVDMLQVPRSLYDEIVADQEGWQEIRSQLSEGIFVDLDRLMVESGAMPAAAAANG